jgi:hypothetical protein
MHVGCLCVTTAIFSKISLSMESSVYIYRQVFPDQSQTICIRVGDCHHFLYIEIFKNVIRKNNSCMTYLS